MMVIIMTSLVSLLLILYFLEVLATLLFRGIFNISYYICKLENYIQVKNPPSFFDKYFKKGNILELINIVFNPLENYKSIIDTLNFNEEVERRIAWEVEHGYILSEDAVDVIVDDFQEKETNNPTSKKVVSFKKAYVKKVEEDTESLSLDEEINYLLYKLEEAYIRKADELGVLEDKEFLEKLNSTKRIKKRVKRLQKEIKHYE